LRKLFCLLLLPATVQREFQRELSEASERFVLWSRIFDRIIAPGTHEGGLPDDGPLDLAEYRNVPAPEDEVGEPGRPRFKQLQSASLPLEGVRASAASVTRRRIGETGWSVSAC